VSQTGRTRTAPAPGALVDRLRFAVCGCSHYESGDFTAFGHLAAEQFDFILHTGDYIYEYRADGGPRRCGRPVRWWWKLAAQARSRPERAVTPRVAAQRRKQSRTCVMLQGRRSDATRMRRGREMV